MKKLTCILIGFIFPIVAIAQGEANIWYFGYNAGLDFSSGSPVALTDGQIETEEGCAAICSPEGQLLFYTDGITVYNRHHQIMQNGTGLMGHTSSTNSANVILKPGSTHIYYIFTTDAFENQDNTNGFRYSVVDMNLDNGNGAITEKNVLIYTLTTEQIGIARHANNIDYWVITHGQNNNAFMAYLLTSSGLSTTPVITNIGISLAGQDIEAGTIKVAPVSGKLAFTSSFNGFAQLFDFDNNTGILSNEITLMEGGMGGAKVLYGAEFSPDESLLYISDLNMSRGKIYQFNLNASDIAESMVTLFDSWAYPGQMQLGKDNKIYISFSNRTHLAVINNPDVVGTGCDFVLNAINLNGARSRLGLPFFIHYPIFKPDIEFTTVCEGESTNFSFSTDQNVLSVAWDFGDGTTSDEISPTHTYSVAGNYTVNLTVTSPVGAGTNTAQITIFSKPVISDAISFTQCDDDNDGIFGFNTSNLEANLLNGLTDITLYYWDENNNPLPSPLPNPFNTGSQKIRVRAVNNNSPACFYETTIPFIVSSTPNIELFGSELICNDSPFSKEINAGLLEGNHTNEYSYSWFLNGSPIISANNYSLTINTEGIYTVEVLNNSGCTATRTITVTGSSAATIENIDVRYLSNQSSVTILVSGFGDYEYSLDNIMYQTSNFFANVVPGIYTVYIRDTNGCGTVTENISVLGIPNFFTPNGDFHNDTWSIKGLLPNSKVIVEIYDRYGKLLKQFNPARESWDGTYKGQPVVSTDYWYFIQLENGKVIKGHFTLKR